MRELNGGGYWCSCVDVLSLSVAPSPFLSVSAQSASEPSASHWNNSLLCCTGMEDAATVPTVHFFVFTK